MPRTDFADRPYIPLLVRTHQRLLDIGLVEKGEMPEMEIRHDPWCPFLRGEYRCTCRPEIWWNGRRVD
jgi:hypothetical protein